MTIEERFRSSIDRWVSHGTMPGGFLRAVLRNDLRDAASRGDDASIANLPAIVAYLDEEVPWNCWGAPDRAEAWGEMTREEREAENRARDKEQTEAFAEDQHDAKRRGEL